MPAISSKANVAYVIPILVGITYAIRLRLSSDSLPSRIATHFDLHGAPNGWMSKSGFMTFSIGFLWLAIIGGILIIQNVMVPQESFTTPMFILGATVGLQVGAFFAIIAAASRDKGFSMLPILCWALGIGCLTWLTARILG
jgi:hypothetical protein